MPNVLIVGSTRGLGASLLTLYASQSSNTVYGIARSSSPPSSPSGANVKWITSLDLTSPECGSTLSSQLKGVELETVIITAGYFATETLDSPKWEDEIKMYTTSAIAPVFLVSALTASNSLPKGSKIVIVSSESGSIALRHEKEGGGNFAHHGSKAASNMVAKLLSLDLKERGVGVLAVHPGFMRTEMTRGVGFDKYWDDGGGEMLSSFISFLPCSYFGGRSKLADAIEIAVSPDEAAKSLAAFLEKFDMSMTGQYWAPRGARFVYLLN
jgi:NAD(P)-dependent dehydrogenase (short-subunit alcohol dehydrogenase family)